MGKSILISRPDSKGAQDKDLHLFGRAERQLCPATMVQLFVLRAGQKGAKTAG
jgi:hypothetical protein